MIKTINITNYGSFKDYKWDYFLDKNFMHRNIIYGRNYSGKTTLSRIFRSLEKGENPEEFNDIKFEMGLENGEIINELDVKNSNMNI